MAEEETGPSNIRVICRFRPINEKEKQICAEKTCMEFSDDHKTVVIPHSDQGGPHNFVFDYVFSPSASQSEVYEVSAKPIVEAVMQGFNGTVFAYGQTSSGKTFTMTGPDLSDSEYMGIIPRMITTVFNQIENSDAKIEFQVKVGYCEIYLEKIKDLLDTRKVNLKVHEDRTRGVYISDLTEEYVSSGDEVYELMKIGNSNREVGFTQMNAGSSRSHSIFILTITQTNLTNYSAKTGKLYLVDLAGSEKVGKTGAAGKRLEEAKNINKSLTMLGNVITALTDGKSSHVPYRDSKLTRVLQDSLGGNSKTSLIVTCSPSPYNEQETISTLRFGVRAKAIKNKPKVNKEYTINELKLMLAQAKEEIVIKDRVIASLKKSLEKTGMNTNVEEIIKKEDEDEEKYFQEEENKVIYNDLYIELEDLRVKYEDETKVSKLLTNQLEDANAENEQQKNDLTFMYKQIDELKDRMAQTESLLNEKTETVEKLNFFNEQLQKDLNYQQESRGKFDIELMTLSSELQESEKMWKEKFEHRNTSFKIQLEEEKEKNTKLILEINSIREELKKSVNSKDDKRLKMLEQNYQNEINRVASARESSAKEYELRIAELKQQLEGEIKKYQVFEESLSGGERAQKKRNDTLERSLEQLNLMYHQLESQRIMHKVEKQVFQKKTERLTERIKELENQLKKLNQKVREEDFENKFLMLKEENEQLKITINRKNFNAITGPSNHIKKVIKRSNEGGFHNARRNLSTCIEEINENLD